jgi:hypothetical protein
MQVALPTLERLVIGMGLPQVWHGAIIDIAVGFFGMGTPFM